MKIDVEEFTDGTQVHITLYNDEDAPQLIRIVSRSVPALLRLFAAKNAEYGENAFVLGERGQFSDIWRKVMKLKKSLWDGEDLTFEGVYEVLCDLGGHVLLTMDMVRNPVASESSADALIAAVENDLRQAGM